MFYFVKPLIPRRIQIFARRRMVNQRKKLFRDVWPVNENLFQDFHGHIKWPGNKKFALVLTHDVESGKGQENCQKLMELEIKNGFRSSFNFVPERYPVSATLRKTLVDNGFEVGVHGLKHDGKLYRSESIFKYRAHRINIYLKAWNAVGFRSPAMHHNLKWISTLNIEYDASTFDFDPFEPQPDGAGTVLPFFVKSDSSDGGYIEMPYTLAQDFTLFILMQDKNIDNWTRKLDWIAAHGGMALINTHPDYMNFTGKKPKLEEYPAGFYEQFLEYAKSVYSDSAWCALPREVAQHARALRPVSSGSEITAASLNSLPDPGPSRNY